PLPLFSFVCAARHPSLHSFPTRRSSDLAAPAPALSSVTPCGATAVCAGAAVAATASTASAVRVLRDRDVVGDADVRREGRHHRTDRKSTRLNSSHDQISYAVFCLKKKKN